MNYEILILVKNGELGQGFECTKEHIKMNLKNAEAQIFWIDEEKFDEIKKINYSAKMAGFQPKFLTIENHSTISSEEASIKYQKELNRFKCWQMSGYGEPIKDDQTWTIDELFNIFLAGKNFNHE